MYQLIGPAFWIFVFGFLIVSIIRANRDDETGKDI